MSEELMREDLALRDLSARLADIELPPEPDMWPWYLLIIIIACLLIAAARLAMRKYQRSKTIPCSPPVQAKALDQLARVEQLWAQQRISHQEAAFRLAMVLRLGLELAQLTQEPPPAIDSQQHQLWFAVTAQLHQARYQNPHEVKLEAELFQHIASLLLQRGTTC